MGWIIFVLVIAFIAQSVRASVLKTNLWVQEEITKCKLKDIELLTSENKDLNNWLGLRRARADENEGKKTYKN